MKFNKKKINLKNKEANELLGYIPPIFIKWGITIIFLIILFVFIISAFVKYPEIIQSKASICKYKNQIDCCVYIEEKDIYKIEKGQKIIFKLVGYPYEEFGVLTGKINSGIRFENDHYSVKVKIDSLISSFGYEFKQDSLPMNALSEIIIDEKSILNKITKR